jgi:hypothetical protein
MGTPVSTETYGRRIRIILSASRRCTSFKNQLSGFSFRVTTACVSPVRVLRHYDFWFVYSGFPNSQPSNLRRSLKKACE